MKHTHTHTPELDAHTRPPTSHFFWIPAILPSRLVFFFVSVDGLLHVCMYVRKDGWIDVVGVFLFFYNGLDTILYLLNLNLDCVCMVFEVS
jgi:hypothetical protein